VAGTGFHQSKALTDATDRELARSSRWFTRRRGVEDIPLHVRVLWLGPAPWELRGEDLQLLDIVDIEQAPAAISLTGSHRPLS